MGITVKVNQLNIPNALETPDKMRLITKKRDLQVLRSQLNTCFFDFNYKWISGIKIRMRNRVWFNP